MKIKNSNSLIPGLFLVLLASGCQTAKKPVPVLPAFQTPAPADKAKPQPKPTQTAASVKTQVPATPAVEARKPEPKPDPVEELVANAEKEYQAGQQEFAAGRNDLAREHFDRAFNLLVGSPSELRSDARFQREFNHVMEGINQVEFAALQVSDNAAEQKSEPAPIDEANEISNYPVDPNLKAKATEEIQVTHSDLPLMMTDQVAGYINYFSTRGRGTLERALQRSGRYRSMIERILRQEGVPQDLIYLAQAESGFHPYAVSRAGARGIWQFMGSRARAYDLHRDMWMDERQDPEKSTRAAARHLKDLYQQFGDWYLAMAAYNSGPGTVQAAVKRTGYADFWELYRRNVLPRETRNYVPIILAVTIMAKNRDQYGLASIIPDPPLAYDKVKLNYPIDLRLAAECVDATPAELQDLNPSLLRMVTPRNFELHLPVGTAGKFQSAVASIPPDMRVWWRYHKVAPGETLMTLARDYHTTARAIAQANQLEMNDTIDPGAKLLVPIAPGKRAAGDRQTYAKRLTVYRVRKGDTVQTVSENLGIPAVTIRRWNKLKGDSLSGRRVLYVHLPVSPAAMPSEPHVAGKLKKVRHLASAQPGSAVRHTVRQGETLYSIANNYKTTVAAIRQTNAHVATLRPGMVLVIPQ